MPELEPKIVVFLCDWSSHPGAGVEVTKVPCSAKVDAGIILKEFLGGADGVLVPGCHPDDCQHVSGKLRTERNMKVSRTLMGEVGLDPERLLFEWVSPDEEAEFAGLMREFTERIRKLGPQGSECNIEKGELGMRLKGAVDAVGSKRLRWLVGKERGLVSRENMFGETVPQEFYDAVTDEAVKEEYLASTITLLLSEETMSVKELASKIGASPDEVLLSIMDMRTMGKVSVTEVRGKSPVYRLK
ncbi:MAG: hydrogenase iron-sulfur subunit [bacterium]